MARMGWLAAWMALGVAPALAAEPYVPGPPIAVPASPDNPLGGAFATFDIFACDGATQLCYLSDRSNAAIDVVSARTAAVVGRLGGSGHVFTGQRSTNGLSGPNGLLLIGRDGQHQVVAGNADSTVLGFDLPATEDARPALRVATGEPDQNRVDEIAYDPEARTILAGNNATATNFASLIDADAGSPGFGRVRGRITFDGGHGAPLGHGLEASAYNPITHSFFQAVQHLGADPASPGGLVEIDGRTGAVGRVMDLADARFGALARCAPSGLSVAASGRMMVGCSVASQSLVIDPAGAGRVAAVVAVSGVDQVSYDPATDRWFLAARDQPGGPVLGVVDARSGAVLQVIPTSFNAHSVAVDPVSGRVFVPEGAHPDNRTCPGGCIAVFERGTR